MFGLEAGIVSSVLAVWIGAVVGLTLIATQFVFQRLRLSSRAEHVTLKSEIPFAPFLALGALLAWSVSIPLSALGLSFPLL
jgi:prepilin signal peptidase PulO-like enzyme (type II secretory pathway)